MVGPNGRSRAIFRSLIFFLSLLLPSASLLLASPKKVYAQELPESIEYPASTPDLEEYAEEVKEGFDFLFKGLLFGSTLDPGDSSQNPDNDYLQLPRYSLNLQLRPDFSLDFRRLRLRFKPRFTMDWSRWEDGSRDGDKDSDSDHYVNEWLAGLFLPKGIFISYGRENIQWGPSFLVSPSNPFFRDNGRANPIQELPGSDFARLVWVPSSSWTASFLANVSEGRQEFLVQQFEPAYALKLDYTTHRKFLSVIPAYRENDRASLGAYAGWTVSDGLFLYGEGNVQKGSSALYPAEVTGAQFDVPILMEPVKDDDDSLQTLMLLGATYTTVTGVALTAEFLLNTAGYSDSEAELYLEFRELAATALSFPDENIQNLGRLGLAQTLDPGLTYLRKHYLMLQYQQSGIRDVLSVVFRYTYNLDDDSSQFIPIVQYDISDYLQLFLVVRHNFGPKNTEFRSPFDYGYQLGLQYSF